MIAVVIVKAVDPAAKTVHGFVLVARARSKRASLSESSAMKIVRLTVAKGTSSEEIKSLKGNSKFHSRPICVEGYRVFLHPLQFSHRENYPKKFT
jgi:hypothetical protein